MLVFRDLLAKGYHPIAAAGIAGNFDHETDGFRAMRPYNEKEDSYGYAHWNGPRKAAFFAWAKEQGLDPKSHAANVGFLDYEMKGEYADLYDNLNRANTLKDATHMFMTEFERPNTRLANFDSRYRRAQDILDTAENSGIGIGAQASGQGQANVPPITWPTVYPAGGGGSYPNNPMPGQYPNSPMPGPPKQNPDVEFQKRLEQQMLARGMANNQDQASMYGMMGLKYADGNVPGYKDISGYANISLNDQMGIANEQINLLKQLFSLNRR
jgi:hypothetical protein